MRRYNNTIQISHTEIDFIRYNNSIIFSHIYIFYFHRDPSLIINIGNPSLKRLLKAETSDFRT